MKKVFFAVAIVSASFAACTGSDSKEAPKDTTVVVTPTVVDSPKVIVTPVDTVKVDSSKMAPKK
jgi:hypothetical protein